MTVKNPRLKTACNEVFQKVDKIPSFCGQCGTPLVFEPEDVGLGACECGHEYSGAELGRFFCSDCGTPINIDEKAREDFVRVRSIEALLCSVPDFRSMGTYDRERADLLEFRTGFRYPSMTISKRINLTSLALLLVAVAGFAAHHL